MHKYNNQLNKNGYKHGMSKTRFYNIFIKISERCNNKKYKNYNNKGIKNEWKSFENFKKDMYQSYLKHYNKFGEKQTTIDRIDNNKNYNKNNCRWATWKQQANNRKNNRLITYNNKTQTIIQWAEELNIKYSTLKSRMNELDWSIEKSLFNNRFF